MKRMYLSTSDSKLSGVCAGIAEYADVDPTVIRLIWVAATVLTGVIPGVIAYFIMAALMPKPEKAVAVHEGSG
jgi:phage shock protein C